MKVGVNTMCTNKTEEILYRVYKDQELSTRKKKEIREKFPNIDATKLFIRITNYQVDKYGSTLYLGFGYENSLHSDELEKKRARQTRKYHIGIGRDRNDEYKKMEKRNIRKKTI